MVLPRRWPAWLMVLLLLGGGSCRAAVAQLADLEVCVITPRTRLSGEGQATAEAVLPRPTLLMAGPLQELRILSAGRLLWQQRAAAGRVLVGPFSWPLPPMTGGEHYTLLVQPPGAPDNTFARIDLRAASAAQLRTNQQRLQRLGSDPAAWLLAIDSALAAGQVTWAWALLYAPQDPRSPDLDALRREVYQRGCG